MMTKDSIRSLYADKISKYLNNGYMINPFTIQTSGVGIAKTDLIKDDEIVRVLMKKEIIYINQYPNEIISILVGKYSNERFEKFGGPLKFTDLEIVEETKFLIVSENRFVSLEEEGEKISELRRKRSESKKTAKYIELGTEYKEIALKYVKKLPKMTSCKLKDIKVTKEVNAGLYIIEARWKSFYIGKQ